MKKQIIIIVAVMVVFAVNPAFAQDGTKTTLGLKLWANSWEITSPSGDSVESDNSVLMVGPSLNIKLDNNMYFGGSVLFTTSDYEFSYDSTAVEKISRTDLDLLVGYMLTPQFGIFVGYKSITGDYSDYWPTTSDKYATGDLTLSGPGFGIQGHVPLSDAAALYGSLSLVFLSGEFTYNGPDPFENALYSWEEDLTGAALEIGVAFTVSPHSSLNVGIKSQAFSGADSDLTHSFVGLTAGYNYTF